MGRKRLAEETVEEVAVEDVPKSSKKLKSIDTTVEDATLDESQITTNGTSNGLPKSRKDLMELPYDDKIAFTSVIAKPMANKKLAKKLFKMMRKAGKISRKNLLRIGLKDVQLRLRKGKTISVFCLFFHNISPLL